MFVVSSEWVLNRRLSGVIIMSKRSPEYTPMCNKHLRFYLSNPSRTEFRSKVAERQFKAVEKVFSRLSDSDKEWLTEIMPGTGNCDITDSYIFRNLQVAGADKPAVDRFYLLLNTVNRRIAIELGYVEENKRERSDIT